MHGIHPELKRVSIGYNSNLDLIVHNATDLFAAMGLEPTDQQNHASIATRTQLAQTLSYFFSKVRAHPKSCLAICLIHCRVAQQRDSSRIPIYSSRSSRCVCTAELMQSLPT